MFFLVVTESWAETIILKSGRRVEGKIVSKTKYCIDVDHQGTVETIFLDDIAQMGDSPSAVPTSTQESKPDSSAMSAPASQAPVESDLNIDNPDQKAIFDICKDFFSHMFDDDIQTWSANTYIFFSKNWLIQQGLIKARIPGIVSSLIVDLKMVSAKVTNDTAEAVFPITRRFSDGTTNVYPTQVDMIKGRNGIWKIIFLELAGENK